MFPLGVSTEDACMIERMNSEARIRQEAEDSASILRLLEMDHVLARGKPTSLDELKKAQDA